MPVRSSSPSTSSALHTSSVQVSRSASSELADKPSQSTAADVIGETSEKRGTKRKADYRASEDEKSRKGALYSFYPTVSKEEWLEIEREKDEKQKALDDRLKASAEREKEEKIEKMRENSRFRSLNYRDRKREAKQVSIPRIKGFQSHTDLHSRFRRQQPSMRPCMTLLQASLR